MDATNEQEGGKACVTSPSPSIPIPSPPISIPVTESPDESVAVWLSRNDFPRGEVGQSSTSANSAIATPLHLPQVGLEVDNDDDDDDETNIDDDELPEDDDSEDGNFPIEDQIESDIERVQNLYKWTALRQMMSYEFRLRTFINWPKQMSQTPERLAEAGFYHTLFGVRVS